MTNAPWAAYGGSPSLEPPTLSLKSRKTTLSAQGAQLDRFMHEYAEVIRRLNLSAEWVAAQLAITQPRLPNRCDDWHHDYVNEN